MSSSIIFSKMQIVVIIFIMVSKLKLTTGIDQAFCQMTCGCSNPNNILKTASLVPASLFPGSMSKLPMGSAHGVSFGQPWSPWGSGSLTKPWKPSSPFIPKGGSRGTFNKPWTAGAPWLQGSKGMADNAYIPRPDSNANIFKTPKKFLPVETRRDKRLKPSDGFILMRRHNKTAGTSAYATAGGRKVQGSGGILGNKLLNGGAFGNKAGLGMGGRRPGNKAGVGMGSGLPGGSKVSGSRPGSKPGGSASNSKPGMGGKPLTKPGPGVGGGLGNNKGPESETFIKKDGNLVEA